MIFRTYRDAQIHLNCTYAPWLRELYGIVRATRGGPVGWMLVLYPVGKPGKLRI